MIASVSFQPVNLSFSNYKTYLFAVAFVAGNLLLPQLCHIVPDGGKMLLPIYFFTLIASYKFGLKVGLLTAILSPLLNNLLFGMPMAALLPVILAKSSLLAVAAAFVASRSRKVSMAHLLIVVLAYQLVGGVVEFALTSSAAMALQDFRLGFPGMLLQVVGGWAVLRYLADKQF